jgi:MFS transporter, PAT family, solute carrier family 33 (acetyl-CoA transportor), member 1
MRKRGQTERRKMIDSFSPTQSAAIGISSNHLLNLARRGGGAMNTAVHLYEEQNEDINEHSDKWNYILLIALYTLQGIPMGLSASIPFLIQQKVKAMTETLATEVPSAIASSASAIRKQDLTKIAYNAQAIFALCSWPFSLKLLWAPIVDSCFFSNFGRRKSWLVPVQFLAGFIMVFGSDYVEHQLGLSSSFQHGSGSAFDVKGVTAFFFILYFLMATQDIAVDGWALTMLSHKNRGKGPVCNSIGQNIGFFLAFVGFLALNDVDSSEKLWRPLLNLPSNPSAGLVSLGGFIKTMGLVMIALTTFVALFKREGTFHASASHDDDAELDASEIGLRETYHRLLAVCKLPAVRWLFVILLTNRFPTALSDKVKNLKAVEFGMSKQTTALLAPTIILPLGIMVPVIAAKIFKNKPLTQFMTAYKLRVTVLPILDVMMLLAVKNFAHATDIKSTTIFWVCVIASTALFSIVDSMQFNAQMTFFAHRVDPAIGGTYMTLLNTAANLGGTWPASVVMYLVGQLTIPPDCSSVNGGKEICTGGREAYFPLQLMLSLMGCIWIFLMGGKVQNLAELPDEAWRTHLDEDSREDIESNTKKGK